MKKILILLALVGISAYAEGVRPTVHIVPNGVDVYVEFFPTHVTREPTSEADVGDDYYDFGFTNSIPRGYVLIGTTAKSTMTLEDGRVLEGPLIQGHAGTTRYSDPTLTIRFEPRPCSIQLTTKSHNEDMGYTLPEKVVLSGLQDHWVSALISATPKIGYMFDYWHNGPEDRTKPSGIVAYKLAVPGEERKATAHFKPLETGKDPYGGYYPYGHGDGDPTQPQNWGIVIADAVIDNDDAGQALCRAKSGTASSVLHCGTPGGTCNCQYTAIANDGYRFAYWIDPSGHRNNNAMFSYATQFPQGGATKHCTATAYFTDMHKYKIGTSSSPNEGGITIGGGEYQAATEVDLTAYPSDVYEFEKWTDSQGNVYGSEKITITVANDEVYTAFFTNSTRRAKLKVNAAANGGGNATVDGLSSVTVEGVIGSKRTFNLKASETQTTYFTGWSDGGDAEHSVELEFPHAEGETGEHTYTASFDDRTKVTVDVSAWGSGSVEGDEVRWVIPFTTYNRTAKATAHSGHYFSHWDDSDGNRFSTSRQIEIDETIERTERKFEATAVFLPDTGNPLANSSGTIIRSGDGSIIRAH